MKINKGKNHNIFWRYLKHLGAMFSDFNRADNYNLSDHFYSSWDFRFEKILCCWRVSIFELFLRIIIKNNLTNILTKPGIPIRFSEPDVGGLNDRLVGQYSDDKIKSLGTGIGKSKKKAEQYACRLFDQIKYCLKLN